MSKKECDNCEMYNKFYYEKGGCASCSFADGGRRAGDKDGKDNFKKIEGAK